MTASRLDRYSTVAIVLHWLIAAAIVVQILLAWRMNDLHTPLGFALTQLHKSVGITILFLSLVRLGWRLANPPPPMMGLTGWERALAHITHWGFYVIMIGMPLTGWIMVSASRIAIPTLLYGVIPWPHVPGIAELAPAAKGAWRGFGHESHEWLAYGAYLLIGLHVAGALKHQLFDHDQPVLARMAPGAKPGRWFDPRLLIIAAGGLIVLALGQFLRPPLPASAPVAPTAHDEMEMDEAPAAKAAVVTPPVSAAAPESPTAAPAAPQPLSHWTVASGSTLGFSTTWGGQAIEGRFDRWTADISFSPDQLAKSKVSVSIDIASIKTGDAQRDDSLPSADWFDAATHPKATFIADRFEKTGEDRYVAKGKLTLRGVTKPLSLPFRLKIDGDKARMSGVTTLDRTAFGVGQGEWQATDQIPAGVKVSVKLTATRG
ncbi:YceI family protein [Phenylobacterium aquaticum]|uniref:YceI family protein n=1 Tax=Phenylobacterium aquaticum TaxID=1763816 RepID=UPI0026EE9FBE|nr:YceI family protein [Phenylobacterium aquaticum]